MLCIHRMVVGLAGGGCRPGKASSGFWLGAVWDGGKGYSSAMSLLFDSFWRAVAYCVHPRVIALSFLPLILMVGLSFVLGYFFWEPAVAAIATMGLLLALWMIDAASTVPGVAGDLFGFELLEELVHGCTGNDLVDLIRGRWTAT